MCPCCGAGYHLDFKKIKGRGRWSWNGNKAKPTLTPSIWAKKDCGWHGHLTDGVFKSC